MRCFLALAALLVACKSSDPPPPKSAEQPPASGPACSNACMGKDSECHQKCLDDDSLPSGEDGGDSCGAKCNKALEACVARCK